MRNTCAASGKEADWPPDRDRHARVPPGGTALLASLQAARGSPPRRWDRLRRRVDGRMPLLPVADLAERRERPVASVGKCAEVLLSRGDLSMAEAFLDDLQVRATREQPGRVRGS